MGEILRRTDRWGREIVLDDEGWYGHIVPRRTYFSGREQEYVDETLTGPSIVTVDVDDPARECFYRPSPLPRPYGGLLVKVVVDFSSTEVDAGEGLVVTVYLTPKPKPGELRRWP